MPGHSSTTAVAITWAASWRISQSASSASSPLLFAVTTAIVGAVGERGCEVAQLAVDLDPERILAASRGPIAAAASAPLAPGSSSSGLPSGSVTVTDAIGGHATHELRERRFSYGRLPKRTGSLR